MATRIAYQGEPGAFSEEAVSLLAPSATPVPCHYFPQLFSAICDQRADLVFAPIENTLTGAVSDSCDLLLRSGLFITAEVVLPIHHQLIALPGTKLCSISTVLSHPVALAQCRRFFAQHPAMTAQPAQDTAGSVRAIMERDDPSRAAIASSRAAALYGGEIIAHDIEDSPRNYTRFLLLSETENIDDGGDKFSLSVRLKELPLLKSLLAAVENGGATLAHLISRPTLDECAPWEQVFLLDFTGPSPHNTNALLQFATELKWLGRYKSAAELLGRPPALAGG